MSLDLQMAIQYDDGHFHLKHGSHHVVVPTKFSPETVFVSLSEEVYDGCGNAPINKIGWSVLDNAIAFDADVNTDRCKVEWLAL